MKKRTDRQPVARSALVVLRDGSCLWFPRATVKRSRTEIRMRTAGGVDVVVPAAGADCLTYGASESRPEPIAQLVNAIDVLRGALGARSPKPHVDPRRLERICKKHHIKRLSLFGSVVRDDFAPASDVDILYEREAGHRETLASFVAANEAFADLFGRRVDFIERSLIENSRNQRRRQSIFEDERVVYENGRARLAGVFT
jgi:predicted nucleotidyltransferase